MSWRCSVELEVKESLLRRAERKHSLGSEVTEGTAQEGSWIMFTGVQFAGRGHSHGMMVTKPSLTLCHPPGHTQDLPSGCSRGVLFLLS